MDFLKIVFTFVGIALVALSVLLPVLMERATGHGGVTMPFASSYLRLLTPFITIASMASSFIAASVILSFEKSRPGRLSVPFGILTLSVFATEIVLSMYLSIVHPLTPTGPMPSVIYALVGLVPFGLACTVFTLATMTSQSL
ncbi:MAG TPA: hypothetical protein VEG61_05905 [Candidatus Dormibacteraeota bacterium]|nr:hypothetical protein [Candidatus Dormibacteraeota bacterium]